MGYTYIHKQAGQKKDAVRVTRKEDIPEFLRKSIRFQDDNTIVLDCVEGSELSRTGVVIGYEKSERMLSGYNCWVIGYVSTNLVEIDGVFYKKAPILKSQPVSEEFPEFLAGATIRHNDDGSWTIKTDRGESTGFPGKAYWVLYGTKADGTLDANILTKNEKSYRDYIVCDEDGNDLGFLSELDPA